MAQILSQRGFPLQAVGKSDASRLRLSCSRKIVGPNLPALTHSGQATRLTCRSLLSSNDTSTSDEVGTDALSSNPAFAAVLQSALQRQGPDALTAGPTPYEEPKRTAGEEILHTSLQECRRKILQLENMQKQVDDMVVREKRQFERLHFALKKAQDDAAYRRTLQKIVEQLEK